MIFRWSSRSTVVSLLALGLVLTGCASQAVVDDSAASIPTPSWRLAGTWHGSTYEIGSASPHYGSTLTYQFEADGRWKATETLSGGRVVEFSGTSQVRGNQVALNESNGRRFVTLTRSGNRLYGMENMRSMAGSRVMIELTRVE